MRVAFAPLIVTVFAASAVVPAVASPSEHLLSARGSRANGKACKASSQCASGSCQWKQCASKQKDGKLCYKPEMCSGEYCANSQCASSEKWSLVETMKGQSFFNHFDFFTDPDPTNGQTAYQDQASAQAAKLAYIDARGNAIIKADSTTKLAAGQNRNSVRLHSKNDYAEGLTVITVNSMPWGDCSGVWPAWWSFDAKGSGWPAGGEIDIVEGIESLAPNTMTLHTDNGCTLAPNSSTNGFAAAISTTDCYAYGGQYGCSEKDSGSASYGKALNAAGGGVWATQFVADGPMAGISIWRFPRNKVPSDLTAGKPQPLGWGLPTARWASSSCDFNTYFGPQTLVLNIALGGDWNAWDSGVCTTGSQQKAIMDPKKFVHAKWNVSSIEVYQRS